MTPPVYRKIIPEKHSLLFRSEPMLPFQIYRFDHHNGSGNMARTFAFSESLHYHDFHDLLFFNEGTGAHVLGSKTYRVQAPGVSFVRPGQLHYWLEYRGIGAWAVAFEDEFLLKMEADLSKIFGREFCFELGRDLCLQPDKATLNVIENLVGGAEDVFLSSGLGKPDIIRSHMSALLALVFGLCNPDDAGRPGPGDDFALIRRFRRLAERYCTHRRPLQGYAADLGVSTSSRATR